MTLDQLIGQIEEQEEKYLDMKRCLDSELNKKQAEIQQLKDKNDETQAQNDYLRQKTINTTTESLRQQRTAHARIFMKNHLLHSGEKDETRITKSGESHSMTMMRTFTEAEILNEVMTLTKPCFDLGVLKLAFNELRKAGLIRTLSFACESDDEETAEKRFTIANRSSTCEKAVEKALEKRKDASPGCKGLTTDELLVIINRESSAFEFTEDDVLEAVQELHDDGYVKTDAEGRHSWD